MRTSSRGSRLEPAPRPASILRAVPDPSERRRVREALLQPQAAPAVAPDEREFSKDVTGVVRKVMRPLGNRDTRNVLAGRTGTAGANHGFIQRQVTQAFSEGQFAPVREAFTENAKRTTRQSCIAIVNSGLRRLFGDQLKKKRLGSEMEKTMAGLQALHLADTAVELQFLDKKGRVTKGTLEPVTLESSALDVTLKSVGPEPGWYLFGLSIMDGYHSALLAADFTTPPLVQVYWMDQIFSGFDNVTSDLDDRITRLTVRWWKAVKEQKGVGYNTVVRIWPIVERLVGDYELPGTSTRVASGEGPSTSVMASRDTSHAADDDDSQLAFATSGHPEITPAFEQMLDRSRGGGQPLDSTARSHMEPALGADFSAVQVHTGSEADRLCRALKARAFTIAQDMFFRSDENNLASSGGRELLAHELTHVVQQTGSLRRKLQISAPEDATEQEADQIARAVVQGEGLPERIVSVAGYRDLYRQTTPTASGKESQKPKINYARARKQNQNNAARDALGWGTKLATVAGGAYKHWADLWDKSDYDAFADTVAAHQAVKGMTGKGVDGILGPKTWSQIGGLGEAIAGTQSVSWPESETVCTLATRERIVRGYNLATEEQLKLEKEYAGTFNTILQSIPEKMLDIDDVYRATGAPGAMVYLGYGTFVSEDQIWAGNLKPGAVMQGWWHQHDYDLLRAGETEEGGRKRRITQADLHEPAGTSFVFVRYDTDTNERLLVRHFGGNEWMRRTEFAKWIAANVSLPAQSGPGEQGE